MKLTTGFIFCLFANYLFSQTSLTLTVMDENKTPISFCSVTWNSSKGLVTDANGHVVIDNVNEVKDSVSISTIGFITQKKSLNDLRISNGIVVMKPKEIALPEVIAIKREKIKEIGSNSKKEGYSYLTNIGSNSYLEAAYFISNYPEYSLLKTVHVFIAKKSETTMPFWIRAYSNENEFPGEDLFMQNIIVNSYKHGWHEISLDSLSFQLPKHGFFISIEWLITNSEKDTRLCVAQTDDIKEAFTFIKIGNSSWRKFLVPSPINKNPSNIMVRVQLLTN